MLEVQTEVVRGKSGQISTTLTFLGHLSRARGGGRTRKRPGGGSAYTAFQKFHPFVAEIRPLHPTCLKAKRQLLRHRSKRLRSKIELPSNLVIPGNAAVRHRTGIGSRDILHLIRRLLFEQHKRSRQRMAEWDAADGISNRRVVWRARHSRGEIRPSFDAREVGVLFR